MRTPSFWDRPEPGLAARLLSPLGRLYGAATARAMAERGLTVGVPVLTVGNFVAGGAGKTPASIALAKLLAASGERPAFLSRGYGGNPATEAAEVRDQSARLVGDEPVLLARVAPTFVSPMRVRAAHLALKTVRPSLLISDDGLQSRAVEPTLAFAVVDGRIGAGNGLCVPAGPLRAPLDAQIAHTDALILVGSGAAGEAVAGRAEAAGKPCFYADIEPEPEARALAGQKVVAFAGIARPDKFFTTLGLLGARLVLARAFPDHHFYRPREIERLRARADALGAVLVTTEKDAVRLPPLKGSGPAPRAIAVRLVFHDEGSLRDHLSGALRRARALL